MTDRRHIAFGPLCVVAGLVVAGCSGDGLVASKGTVTCDGELIADGAISFHPLDKGVAPQGGRIVAGRFQIRGRPGRQRVEIVASRPKPDAVEISPGMKPLEQFVPARYNAASTLEIEVSPAGPNVFDFDLTSSP
jgi:hypothetical protein